jgi:hypothetical protein
MGAGEVSLPEFAHTLLRPASRQMAMNPASGALAFVCIDWRAAPFGRESSPARHFRNQGVDVWAATDEQARRDFARSPETLRVVQYHSSRGLEGWTVVVERLDLFWQNRFQFFANLAPESALRDPSELAAEEPWRWRFMALTRPIDSLIISNGSGEGPAALLLRRVANRMPNIVELGRPKLGQA